MRLPLAIGLVVFSLTVVGNGTALHAEPGEGAPSTTAQPALTEADEAAIRGVVASFCDSWTKHDMDAMHVIDTPDAEWLNVVGNHWRGLAEVRKGHANYHRFLAARSTCSVESVSVRPIAPEVAISVNVLHFAGLAPDGKPEDTRSRSSMVMVKRNEEWKIIHFQNTIIDPAIQGNADPLNFDEETGLPKTSE